MGRILSTQDVPQKERFDYWNHIVSQALGRLDTISPGVASFSGRIDHHKLVDLDFVRVKSDQLRVLRTEKLVAQETSEIIKVNFHLAGRGRARWIRRWCVCRAAKVGLEKLSRILYKLRSLKLTGSPLHRGPKYRTPCSICSLQI